MADSLEKGTEHEDEYMISEKELLVNRLFYDLTFHYIMQDFCYCMQHPADLGSYPVDLYQSPRIWVPLTVEHSLLELCGYIHHLRFLNGNCVIKRSKGVFFFHFEGGLG